MERVKNNELPIVRGHVLTNEDKVLRKQILNLMTRFETSWKDEADFPYLDQISKRLAEPYKDGLIQLDATSCRIDSSGLPFIRNICMAFDSRLAAQSPETKIFSQTI